MLSDHLEGWDGGEGEREGREGGDACILMPDSRWMAETTQPCKTIILQLKISFKKDEKFTFCNGSKEFKDLSKISRVPVAISHIPKTCNSCKSDTSSVCAMIE